MSVTFTSEHYEELLKQIAKHEEYKQNVRRNNIKKGTTDDLTAYNFVETNRYVTVNV